MARYNFTNDYSEGAHPDILKRLTETNLEQHSGYGEDKFCIEASEKIKQYLNSPQSDIHFVGGGTQANLICISAFLKPYESVIAAKTGHIEIHETGAIEFTGHKINTYETIDGKLKPEQIEHAVDFHYDEHMVVPRLVYISNTTELGTIYTKAELEAISNTCKKFNLILFIDGARLGAALVSPSNDLSIEEINNYADAYYIGGTKNGALIGEAIVINNPTLKEKFRYNIKQKGALFAKGRLIGIQFLELFNDNKYIELAKHANNMAMKLADGISNAGYSFLSEPVSNAIFPIFPNTVIKKLEPLFGFYVWSKIDDNTSAVRLVCSWATLESAVDDFIENINSI